MIRHMISRIPWSLVILVLAACVPWLGSRFYTFLATDIVILALFAASLNLLLGTTGLVSFGHAAYFGIGAYTCAILMKTHGVAFALALVAGTLAIVPSGATRSRRPLPRTSTTPPARSRSA